MKTVRTGLDDTRQVMLLSELIELQGYWPYLQTLLDVLEGAAINGPGL